MTKTERELLATGMVRLAKDINAFDRTISANIDAASWQEAALVLRLAREQVELLAAVIGAIEARIIVGRRAERLREDTVVEGVGIIGVHRPKNRKRWDHPGLANVVIDRHLEAREGELPTPWEVRDWLMDAGSFGYWRTTVLKGLDIDPDDYSVYTLGHPKVSIVSSDAPPVDLSEVARDEPLG